MKLYSKIGIFLGLSFVLLNSCTTNFKVSGDVKLKEIDYSIENMSYFDKSQDRIDRTIAKAIKKNLMRSSLAECGYFYFDRDFGQDYNVGPILVPSLLVPLTLGLGSVLYLVGLPTDWGDYSGDFTLYLFDSNGDFIKSFTGNGKTTGVAGLYYDASNGDKAIARAIDQIFSDMEYYADEINAKLIKAGANTIEKEKTAIEKIEAYINKIKGSKSSSSSSSYSSYSSSTYSAPSYSSSSSYTSSSTQDAIDAINDFSKQLTDTINGKCSYCKGTGKCGQCNGTGKIYGSNCWSCKGTGVCTTCGGDGDYLH